MDGRCSRCTKRFGIFTKEYGCHNCGFSFCKKCCSFSAVVPKLGKSSQSVCEKCFKTLTGQIPPEKTVQRYSPPENFKRRVAALSDQQQSTSAKLATSGPDTKGRKKPTSAKFKNLSPKDREIAERLEKLKEERKREQGPIPSTEEIEERLARLKGEEPTKNKSKQQNLIQPKNQTSSISSSTFAHDFTNTLSHLNDEIAQDATTYHRNQQDQDGPIPPASDLNFTKRDSDGGGAPSLPTATLSAEADKLISETKEELNLEEKNKNADREISQRLAKLTGSNLEGKEFADDSLTFYDETDEEKTRKLLQQIAEEEKLEEKIRSGGFGSVLDGASGKAEKRERNESDSDTEELPWCCICNEDAVLRCLSCDGDLFCKRCFKEGHDQYDQKNHKTTKYQPPHNV